MVVTGPWPFFEDVVRVLVIIFVVGWMVATVPSVEDWVHIVRHSPCKILVILLMIGYIVLEA